MQVTLDTKQIQGFGAALMNYPAQLANELAAQFGPPAVAINEMVKQEVLGGLKVKNRGSINAFKVKSSDPNKVRGNINKVFADWYTKWKAGGIFETGGNIKPKNAKSLMIFTDNARGPGGKPRWKPAQIKAMVASGKMRIVPSKAGPMIVRDVNAGLTKTGKPKKNARTEVIAFLKRGVTLPKKYSIQNKIASQQERFNEAAAIAVDMTWEKVGVKPK